MKDLILAQFENIATTVGFCRVVQPTFENDCLGLRLLPICKILTAQPTLDNYYRAHVARGSIMVHACSSERNSKLRQLPIPKLEILRGSRSQYLDEDFISVPEMLPEGQKWILKLQQGEGV